MKFLSLAPFVPSGENFGESKKLFQELGFRMTWSDGSYAGFEQNGCRFILQQYDNKEFAENFMVSVGVENAEAFWQEVMDKKLTEKFGIIVNKPIQQPYGKEVNMIDLAGVCWHFVEA